MKAVPQPLLDYLLSNTEVIFGHLFVVTLANGASDYFTDMDIDVPYSGNLYKANSLRIEQIGFKFAVGVEVDEQSMRISATPTDVLVNSKFLSNVAFGILDGAYIRRSRVFWAVTTGNTWLDVLAAPLGVVDLSYMRVSTIDKIGRSSIELKLKSPMVLLNQSMPRNYYQSGCLWNLYQTVDAEGFGCLMVKSNFAVTYQVGTLGGGVNSLFIPAGTVAGSKDNGPGINVGFRNGVSASPGYHDTTGHAGYSSYDGNHTFLQGRLLFTSGLLQGQQFLIKDNDANGFFTAYPLPLVPAVNDTFTAYPGCTKTTAACGLKFGIGATDATYVGPTTADVAALFSATGDSQWRSAPTFSGNMVNFRGFNLVPPEHYGL